LEYFKESNKLTKIISIIALITLVLGITLLNPLVTYAFEEQDEEEILQNVITRPSSSSSSSKSHYSVLDPNPSLIDKDGNLINNITSAASLPTYRSGTIADGVSKLILVVDSNNTLQFSINGTKADNLTNGAVSSLNQSSNSSNLSSNTNLFIYSSIVSIIFFFFGR
jgi:hypothetical protein